MKITEIGPKHVPQGSTTEQAGNFRIREFQLVNYSQGSITVSIQDSNGIYFVPPISLGPSGVISGYYELGRYMPGIVWSASSVGIDGFISAVGPI